MSKPKIWIVVALVLVFAAGVVGGIFAEKWFFMKRPGPPRSAPGSYPSMARWAKELGLTDDQQTKIQEIFKANEKRFEGLRTDYFKNLGEIRDQLKKDIDAVLTPEQKQKMEAMIQKQMDAHRKDMERRGNRTEPQRNPNPNPKIKKESVNEKEVDHRSGDPGGGRRSHPGLQPH